MITWIAGVFFWCALCSVCEAQLWGGRDQLEYQKRYNEYGTYYEGIVAEFAFGSDTLELIAAFVHYPVPAPKEMPEKLSLEFYLKDSANVSLRVQELTYDKYYQLDRNQSVGEGENTFSWSTEPVLRHLFDKPDELYNLVAIARLNRSRPSTFEQVAPVIFYRSDQADFTAGKYVFIFRPSKDMKLDCSLYQEQENPPQQLSWVEDIYKKQQGIGDAPFFVSWDGKAQGDEAPEAWYQLHIAGYPDPGYPLTTQHPIEGIVRFYHHTPIKKDETN